jgi:trans-2-enoyl-CoA reductase
MANEDSRHWEQQLREAAARAEQEVRRVVTYLNDEVVPDIRRNGSDALRAAAAELQRLAQRMDDRRAAAAAAQTPAPDKDKPTP